MFRASYITHPLQFIRPAGTSRGILKRKPCWYIRLESQEGIRGIGEVSFIPGLSLEEETDLEIRLDHVCKLINRGEMDPRQSFPSMPGVQFALETALRDMENRGRQLLYPSEFTEGRAGILTNGLVWMGDKTFMLDQIRKKMELGFRVLKMKVGALDFSEELEVLRLIRSEYGGDDLEIRLDANGAWSPDMAFARMEQLSLYRIHSIEQPIAPGQPEELARICCDSTIPVALDEELIGMSDPQARSSLLEGVRPAYIILKPGLLGGVSQAEDWIKRAKETGTGWWVTSALESNIGLNAIAQWTWQLGVNRHQGLGTGALYINNIPSPLQMQGEQLWHRSDLTWDLNSIRS